MTEDLHQQPAGIPAGAALQRQGLVTVLNPRLHADVIVDFLFQTLIEVNQEVVGRPRFFRYRFSPGANQRTVVDDFEIRLQLLLQRFVIAERKLLGGLVMEKIERIDHRHIGNQLNLDTQVVGLFRKHQAGKKIAKGILLPVDEMIFGTDSQRIAVNRSPAVRGGTQTQGMWRQLDRTIKMILCHMVNSGAYGHSFPL